MQKQSKFGSIRSVIWPIKKQEFKKIFPILAIFFLVSSVYHLLRTMKNAVMITLKGAGPDVVPYLKVGGVLPTALLVTAFYAYLASKHKRKPIFIGMLVGFIVYFLVFLLYLFPYTSSFEALELATFLKKHVLTSDGFRGLLAIIRYWNLSLFYVISEIWSSLILATLLWGFVNEVTKLEDARRYYAIYGIGINSAGVIIGLFMPWFEAQKLPYIDLYAYNYQWVFYQLSLAIICSVLILIIYYFLDKPGNFNIVPVKKEPVKEKISFLASLARLVKSPYLIFLAIIVLAYNTFFNIADMIWLDNARASFPRSADFKNYALSMTTLNGIVATLGGFITSYVIKKLGWTYSALLTPIIWTVTGFIFYFAIVANNLELSWFLELSYYLSNPSMVIISLGTLQIVLGRSFKYTVFDATKEMAYIPLEKRVKRQSKAVIDGLISRFGKAFGSLICIITLFFVPNISKGLNILSWIFIGLAILWIYAVLYIGKSLKNNQINVDKE